MGAKRERAAEAFDSGFNCAQSVLSAFCEQYGVDRETALRLSGGMGSGFRCGEICGAASGGAMVIGMKYGQSKQGDTASKSNCGAKTMEFLDAFKERYKSLSCRELLADKDAGRAICAGIVEGAAAMLEDMGY